MEPILTRCGYRCDLCLAYRPNIEAHPENQQILSDGWFEYFGFRIPPDDLVCDGCWSKEGQWIDQSCPVRPCVIQRGLENCACCEAFICEKLEQRIVDFDRIQAQHGKPIPTEDRQRFIQPYESLSRLEALRPE
jgi:hypothetical protein